ncbi:MAG: extracellular solute-binding protein [Ruminiclostridium sp.]|nr:extracellular solute-binding protein [Ruminiclostridium sp.]
MKKFLVLMLVLVLGTSIAACTPVSAPPATDATTSSSTGDTTSGQDEKPSLLFDKPVTIEIMAPYHQSWPFQEDWYVLDMIKKNTNVIVKMDAVDPTGFIDKYNITMVSGELPDIIFDFTSEQGNQYGPDGAFVNILEHLDIMPNFKAWSEKENAHVLGFMSAEGALYGCPIYGIGNTNLRGWLYRKDIFDKNNLKAPKTQEEFYNVLKALKSAYPESYPLTYREGLTHFKMASTAWGTGNEQYYDWDQKVWKYGPIEDSFKEMVTFYNKLYNDELIPPDVLTITTQQWQQILSANNAFLTLDYVVRVDGYNVPMRKENAEVNWRYMEPLPFGSNGQKKLRFSAESNTILNVCNSDNQDATMKFLDWMYSEEGSALLSWGEDGVTYKVGENGRKWIGSNMTATSLRQQYGLSTNGLYTLFDYSSHSATFSEELKEADAMALSFQDVQIPRVALTQAEKEFDMTTGTSIRDHYRAEISKFIIGERPLSEFDQYVQEIKDLGLDSYLEMVSAAFKRQLGE